MAWYLEKCFPRKFKWKIFSENCKKFRNVILFADYIKFSSQTFNCYIYFILNIYFSISSLNLIFILTFILIFIIVICFSLIIFLLKIFIYQIWSLFFWLLLILFEINYEMLIIIILISLSFIFFLLFRFDLYYFDYHLFYLR